MNLLLFLTLRLISVALTRPSTISDAALSLLETRTKVLSPVSNLSAELPPTDFVVNLVEEYASLPEKSCYGLTLTALALLAFGDFDGQIPRSLIIRSRDYPGVRILIDGPDVPGPVERRYAIWGLLYAIDHFAIHNAFTVSVFTLSWQGTHVGTIGFRRPPTLLGLEGNTTSLTQNRTTPSDDPLDNGLTLSQPPQGEDNLSDQLDFRFGVRGAPVTLSDVMMITVGGLVDAAINPRADLVPDGTFLASFPSFTGFAALVAPERTAPPFFTYEVLIQLLERAGKFYLRLPPRNLKELQMAAFTAEGQPVVGGTYFARDPQGGMATS